MDAQALHDKAQAAAQKAVDDLIAKHGVDSNLFFYCGFGWVRFKPARGKFVQFLKANNLGYKAYNGGWSYTPSINYPENSPIWQSMDLKEAAAAAYANVLRDEGIDAWMESRAD